MIQSLRPYQLDIASAVLDSVFRGRGLTFTVEIARQGGKNELSAQLELQLLTRFHMNSRNLVKCSPTFKPQAVISMTRLKDRLDEAFPGQWSTELGYIVKVGSAKAIFLSADESARVVGHTAHLLLEIDEAQDVSKDKFSKEFRPMGATTNVTTVLYGTAWDDTTLLEEAKQTNLELERKDGIKRHFSFDWQAVAKHNPAYLSYVEGERNRLGENHPLFRTQYCLLPVRGGGGFLSSVQRAQLQGDHPRLRHHQPEHVYVGSIDLAGEAETEDGAYLTTLRPHQDSTVVTIGELDFTRSALIPDDASVGAYGHTPLRHDDAKARVAFQNRPASGGPSPLAKGGQRGNKGDFSFAPSAISAGSRVAFQNGLALDNLSLSLDGRGDGEGVHPSSFRSSAESQTTHGLMPSRPGHSTVRVVQHYAFTGKRHAELYPQLVDLLKNVWHCKRIVVDATGVGQPVYSFLREALGSAVSSFVFTASSKSELGFNLLAAVNSGRLRMYAPDGSEEYQEFWSQMEKARSLYRPSQTMNFYVDPSHGHDDYLMSLALLVEASSLYEPRVAKGRG